MELTKTELSTLDKRGQLLGGEQCWLPNGMCLASKTFKLKGVDFLNLSRGPAFFLFHGMFSDDPLLKEGIFKLFRVLRALLLTNVDADNRPPKRKARKNAQRLATEVAEVLSVMELSFPLTYFPRVIHSLLHVPFAVLRWNSVRNFWAFSMER